ncbi:hypothetical protein ACI2OW_22990 [Pseudomonas shirazica]|uniref:hypothetical protein n=1 Tax=Pseudomonas TaxID=286 RepID=UPI003852A5CC
MPITKPNAIKIMDIQNMCIGSVENPAIAEKVISGTFLPTQHYKKYEKHFSDLEQTANKLLLTHANQLERQIQALAFYAVTLSNRKISIENLQIMENQIVFTITYAEDAEAIQYAEFFLVR